MTRYCFDRGQTKDFPIFVTGAIKNSTMKTGSSFTKLLPVLFGFFIMGFVDVVGIATNYVKQDFSLSDTLANLLPMMVF